MTVDTTGDGAVVPYNPDEIDTGLEDIDASDLRMPRLNVDHKRAVFVNTLTKEEFTGLTCVFLGLVKQRIFWPEKMGTDPKPYCKSPDNIHGFPQTDPALPKSKQFPWQLSNFTPDDVKLVELAPGETREHKDGWSSNGHGVLSCAACKFSEWGRDLDGKGTPPPCNEQHTYPLLYLQEYDDGSQVWVPAIFTTSRTGITPSKQFLNGFAQAQQPFFTQYVTLTLRQQSRGDNVYCVPEFRKTGPSDRNQWGVYQQNLRQIRTFLRAAPRPRDDSNTEQVAENSNENTAPAVTQPEPAAPAPAPAAPTAPPAPAQPAPAPAAPPAPPAAVTPTPPAAAAAPPPTSAAAAAPPAPPAPPRPPAPPTPAQAPQPAAAAAPQAAEDDDLPF